jgi:hypothetical protein
MLWEDNQCLAHYGIIGQRWGIRRFQNKDGSLTEEGKKRYYENTEKLNSDIKTTEKAIGKSLKKTEKLNDKTINALFSGNWPSATRWQNKNVEETAKRTTFEKTLNEMKQILSETTKNTPVSSIVQNEVEKQSAEKVNADRKLISDLKRFDTNDLEGKRGLGDSLLKSIEDYRKNGEDHYFYHPENEDNFQKMEQWLENQISRKSGSATSDSVTKASEIARKNLAKNSEEMNKRQDEIKKEINFVWPKASGSMHYKSKEAQEHFARVKAENQRLENALRSDSVWTALNQKNKKLQGDWAGVVLRDIGFRDTPENRGIIWPYIIEAWNS